MTLNITQNSALQPIQPNSREAKTIKASKEWESYFVGLMLKEMRKTVPHTTIDGEKSFAMDTYYEMMDNQIARNVAENGGFGLAKEMMKTMAKQQNITINQEMINRAYRTDLNSGEIINKIKGEIE